MAERGALAIIGHGKFKQFFFGRRRIESSRLTFQMNFVTRLVTKQPDLATVVFACLLPFLYSTDAAIGKVRWLRG